MDPQQSKKLITQLYAADQAERLAVPWEQLDWTALRANDRARLEQVKQIANNQQLIEQLDGQTVYELAMLFHHSEFDENVKVAISLADVAGDKGHPKGYWLGAAAEDRLLQRAGKAQKWGTQFEKINGDWQQYQLTPDEESGVTDEMRVKRGLPIRANQLKEFLASGSAT